MYCKFLHTGFVSKDTSLRTFRTRINSKHSQLTAIVIEYMNTEFIDRSTFTGPRHTTNTYTNRLSTVGQAFFDDLLRLYLMVWIDTFYKSHSLTENRNITFYNTIHHFWNRQHSMTKSATFQIRIDN